MTITSSAAIIAFVFAFSDSNHNTNQYQFSSKRELLTKQELIGDTAEVKQFEEWDSYEDVDVWKMQYEQNGGSIPEPIGYEFPEIFPDAIDIDRQGKYFYIPPQESKPQMRQSVLKHWFENPPTNLSNPSDYPLNQDSNHPTIVWNGRIHNPITSKKPGSLGGNEYWTDDGKGDKDNLWTVALHNKNMDGITGDLHWATMYSFQSYHTNDEGIVTSPKFKYGYIVVFETNRPVDFVNPMQGTEVPLVLKRSEDVIPRINYYEAARRGGYADALVLTEHTQEKYKLRVIRVYILDNSRVTRSGYAGSECGTDVSQVRWNDFCEKVLGHPEWKVDK